MIVGITHDKDGTELQRLAVTHKVAIGVPPREGRNSPDKLDHFIFQRHCLRDGRVAWEIDEEITKHYGERCREFWIMFHSDDISQIFQNELAWWGASGKKCWGDGLTAIRRTEKKPSGEVWSPCKEAGCVDYLAERCSECSDLYFVPVDYPCLGSVWKLHSNGIRSIGQLHSSLTQLYNTFDRLAGLRMMLKVSPEKTSFVDKKDGKRKSTTIFALSLELDAEDYRKMIAKVVEPALEFDRARRMLSAGTKVEYEVEDDPEQAQAPAITAEFYPENQEAEPPASVPEADEELKKLFDALSMNQAQRYQALGQYRENLGALKARLRAEVEKRPEAEPPGKTAPKPEPPGKPAPKKSAKASDPLPTPEKKPVEKQGAWGF